MSKIGKPGTIFSIFSGLIFIAWALIFLFWGITSQSSGTEDELCIITAIPIMVFGVILFLGGLRQLKGIKEGKEYGGPPDGIKLL